MRTITFKTKDIIIPLFKSLIRYILECGNVVWSPNKKSTLDSENPYRDTSSVVIGMKDFEYEDRLRAFNLPSIVYTSKREYE